MMIDEIKVTNHEVEYLNIYRSASYLKSSPLCRVPLGQGREGPGVSQNDE